MVATGRRRRKPRWLLFGIGLTAIVLAVNAAISARSPGPSRRLGQLAYLDRVRPLITRSSDEGGRIGDVRNRAATLGRAGIANQLQAVVRDAQSVENSVAGASPPSTLHHAQDLLVAAMAIRTKAAAALQGAMQLALADGPADQSVGALSDAGQDMVAADRAYQLFRADLPDDVRTEGAVPTSQWAPDPTAWAPPQLGVFVAALRSSQSLAPVHDVAVVLAQSVPPPVGQDGAAGVVPMTRLIKVSAVVADVGNEPERHVTVTATLTGPGGVQSVRDFVDLSPGQSTAMTLGDLYPLQGASETLTVRAVPVSGETNTADNQQVVNLEFK